MLQKLLFIVSIFALTPALDAAAIKEPIITAFAWREDSLYVAVGFREGLKIFDVAQQKWIVASGDGSHCTYGCGTFRHGYAQVGVNQVEWIGTTGDLLINGYITFNLDAQTDMREAGFRPRCFRCRKREPSDCIVYNECINTFCCISPDKKWALKARTEPSEIFVESLQD